MKLSRLFLVYLKLVERTSTITYGGMELLQLPNIVGFWHEDSFVSHLILKKLADYNQKATVLVTEHWRGNIIQEMVEHFQGDVFRVAYNGRTIDQFKRLFQEAKTTDNIIVMAFDGPKGPRHQIKKIAFLLANKNQKNLIGLHIQYRWKIRIFGRWDHYAIPLLFNQIKIQFIDLGKITASDIQHIRKKNQILVNQLYPEWNTLKDDIVWDTNDVKE